MSSLRRPSVLCCAVLLCAAVAEAAPRSQRAKYNFNSGWRLFVGDPRGARALGFDDSAWEVVWKLRGRRTLSDPVRVLVDERVAF